MTILTRNRTVSNNSLHKIQYPEVREAARHNWPGILSAFGIDASYLTKRHSPCPGCGGTDRFTFDDKEGRGTFYCRPDNLAGDGFSLLCHVHGWDTPEAFRRVAEYMGVSHDLTRPLSVTRPVRKPAPPPEKSGYARAIWQRVDQRDSVVASHPYCQKKGIEWAAGAARAEVSGKIVGNRADCLVIPIRDAEDTMAAVQCINPEGSKQSFGAVRGHYLLLGNDLDPALDIYVVEGWASGVAWVFRINNGNACCAVAFGKANQQTVAEILASRYQGRTIAILKEQD